MPRDTRAPAEKLSPSAFMRQLRPELYSDTIDRTTYKLDAPTLGYHLETRPLSRDDHITTCIRSGLVRPAAPIGPLPYPDHASGVG
jgi:hypothetical protein